jgi:predicted transposase YbfD/YdcC
MATGFAGSRAIVRLHSTRIIKKSGQRTEEDRYYLSSQHEHERSGQSWVQLIRSHWAVENRNHWRRDATLGEDTTRLRHPQALANLALLRNLCLRLFDLHHQPQCLPAKLEYFTANPSQTIALILTAL